MLMVAFISDNEFATTATLWNDHCGTGETLRELRTWRVYANTQQAETRLAEDSDHWEKFFKRLRVFLWNRYCWDLSEYVFPVITVLKAPGRIYRRLMFHMSGWLMPKGRRKRAE